jgi:WD40 repeat protein/serine/threonine protein kinase
MFERFTDQARKTMAIANQEAFQLCHKYIDTEHILLSLLREDSDIAAIILRDLGVDITKVRIEVKKLVKPDTEIFPMGKLPQTPLAKKVIEYSIEEARLLKHRYIDTGHILLGLLRVTQGLAVQVLTNLGVKSEDIRREVLNSLGVSTNQGPVNPEIDKTILISEQDKLPNKHKTTIEATQSVGPEDKTDDQVRQPLQQKVELAQSIQTTIKQTKPSSIDKTICAPKANQSGYDIAATIATPIQKDAEEIQREEQKVPAEWEEGQTILDLYEVKKVHTGGGMGLVYKIHHKNWNMDLAVKSPRADFFKTEEQKKSFIDECKTWINLGLHPNIVSCYYVRNLGGIPRVFAEYVEGGSLKDWIDNRKLYEGGKEKALERILDIAIQFAWGLHYAHEHEEKLVHQDVKPANVMMTNEGEAKVTDFGLAKARAVTNEVSAVGSQQSILVSSDGMTPAYCSPEQANKQPLSHKTDIWSWGLSLLEMFAGEVFWRAGQAALEALKSYLETSSEDEALPPMPDALVELLKQCFQRNSDDRPKDMQEILARLKDIYKNEIKNEYPRPEPKPAELLADGLNNKAVSMLDLGKKEEAEKLYEEALKADPHHPEATYNRGLLLWRSCFVTDDKLVQQLEDIRTTCKENWREDYLLSQVHIERGDYESAAKLLKCIPKQESGFTEVKVALQHVQRFLDQSAGSLKEMKGHLREVQSVCLSHDGLWAFSGSWDDVIRMWDIKTGECVRTFGDKHEWVQSICLSEDGRYIVSGSKNMKLWDVSTGRCIREFEGHTEPLLSVCITKDGQWAISGSGDNTLRIWEITTGKCVKVLEGHAKQVRCVCVSADGSLLLSGSLDRTLRLWDIATGECVRKFEGHTHGINSVCLSADGLWAISGSADKTLRLWDVFSGKVVRTLEGHTHWVSSVRLSPDCSQALSGGWDATLRLWDIKSGRCLCTLKGNSDAIFSIYWSSDGKYAITGSNDRIVRIWRISHRQLGQFCSLALCKTLDNIVQISVQASFREFLHQGIVALEQNNFCDALDLLTQARTHKGYENHPDILEPWFMLSLKVPRIGLRTAYYRHTLLGHNGRITRVSLSANGRWALSSDNKTMRLWNVFTGECVYVFGDDSGGLHSFPLCIEGNLALVGNSNATISLLDIVTKSQVREFIGHTGRITSACLSGDGRRLLSASEDNTLRFWDIDTGKCLRTLEGHSDKIHCAWLSNNGQWAMSKSSDATFRLWNIASGRWTCPLENNPTGAESFYVSPNGQELLFGTGLMFHEMKLWSMVNGEFVRTFKGHTRPIRAICLSSDGRWGLSASEDKTVRLWEIATGKCMRIFKGHEALVSCVSLSADGHWIVSGSDDGTLRVWELDWNLKADELVDWEKDVKFYLVSVAETNLCKTGKKIYLKKACSRYHCVDENQ